MKFKTRLVITFLTIILLPLVLASTAFLCIGAYLSREQEEYGIRTQDYNILIDPTQASKSISDEIFFEVKEILDNHPADLEDMGVLARINERIDGKSSYILVRKQNSLYYAGNELAASQIFDKLPDFEEENIEKELGQSVYYDDMKKMVRQMDFHFTDGSEGSFFVITRANSILSKMLCVDSEGYYIYIVLSNYLTRNGIGRRFDTYF